MKVGSFLFKHYWLIVSLGLLGIAAYRIYAYVALGADG
jgi:hypothetical protein